MRVTLVSFRDLGQDGGGKLSPRFFVPIFGQVLRENNIGLDTCWADELRRSPGQYKDQIVILVYREVWAHVNAEFGSRVELTERIARENNVTVLHGIELGRLIADKTRTNLVLREAGIPVPELMTGKTAGVAVFSNENCATGAAVQLCEPHVALDPERYNTAFVDTRHEYAGQSYYVALRAMAVGTSCTSIFVRARATREGNPSVHNEDTPSDPGLLNHLYERIVLPRKDAIVNLCGAIGNRLGLAFYSHDILPCADSERLYVCETGFKFDNPVIRLHLAPLGDRIPFNDHAAAAARAAHAFIDQARLAGYLDRT